MTETRSDILRFSLNGEAALADPAGVLVLPGHDTLIVSDLHFEKASSFAMQGRMLPPYDTRETLIRLAAAIERHAPARVIALGDSFHDMLADRRMDDGDAGLLQQLVAERDEWIWIEGNHDPAPPPQFGGEVCEVLRLGDLILRHEPHAGAVAGEIAGHLHPCAKVSARGRAVRRRCFATDGRRLVMPAFGAFTGGLNICDPAFRLCFGRTPDALVMSKDRVHAVSARKCVPDRGRAVSRG